MVRALIERIRVIPDKTLQIMLKGGIILEKAIKQSNENWAFYLLNLILKSKNRLFSINYDIIIQQVLLFKLINVMQIKKRIITYLFKFT